MSLPAQSATQKIELKNGAVVTTDIVAAGLQSASRVFPALRSYGFTLQRSKSGRCVWVHLVRVDAAGDPVDVEGEKIAPAVGRVSLIQER